MKNSEKKIEIQLKLFEEIRKHHSSPQAIVNIVSDVLKVSASSAYRRMCGNIVLSIGEAHLLCKKFGVSFNLFTGSGNSNSFQTLIHVLKHSTPGKYCNYTVHFLSDMETVKEARNASLHMPVVDFPSFTYKV